MLYIILAIVMVLIFMDIYKLEKKIKDLDIVYDRDVSRLENTVKELQKEVAKLKKS